MSFLSRYPRRSVWRSWSLTFVNEKFFICDCISTKTSILWRILGIWIVSYLAPDSWNSVLYNNEIIKVLYYWKCLEQFVRSIKRQNCITCKLYLEWLCLVSGRKSLQFYQLWHNLWANRMQGPHHVQPSSWFPRKKKKRRKKKRNSHFPFSFPSLSFPFLSHPFLPFSAPSNGNRPQRTHPAANRFTLSLTILHDSRVKFHRLYYNMLVLITV